MKKPPKPDFVYDPLEDKGKAAKSKTGSDFVFDPTQKPKEHPHSSPKEEEEIMKKKSDDFTDLGKKPKKPRWRRILRWFLILTLLATIAAAAYILTHAAKVSTNPFDFTSRLKGEQDGRVNILLLGVGDPGHDGETLADTNIIVSINTKTKPYQVAMIGIPRDTRVLIPGEGYHKINYANALGEMHKPANGAQVAEKTIEQNFGIPIHYYVRGNFSGLKQAVDAVGGIDIDVKEAINDPEYPCEKNEGRSCGFKLKAGPTHMDGSLALKYARCRKGTCGDDFGRAMRQQEVLTAMREKALSSQTLSNPSKLNDLINAASNNVKTDLSLRNIQRLQEITKDISKNDLIDVVFSLKPNGFLVSDKSSSDLLPVGGNYDEIQSFVRNIFTVGPIWKEEATVTIENGTTTVGLGGKFKTKLEDEGMPITISSLANAKTRDYTASQIIDYTGGAKPNTASYLAKLLGVEVTQPAKPVKNPVVDFEVILGADYAEKVAPTSSNTN